MAIQEPKTPLLGLKVQPVKQAASLVQARKEVMGFDSQTRLVFVSESEGWVDLVDERGAGVVEIVSGGLACVVKREHSPGIGREAEPCLRRRPGCRDKIVAADQLRIRKHGTPQWKGGATNEEIHLMAFADPVRDDPGKMPLYPGYGSGFHGGVVNNKNPHVRDRMVEGRGGKRQLFIWAWLPVKGSTGRT
jgi:hypothetical protein